MFDLSPEKLVVLAVVAMVVLGPDRLPSAARSLGKFVHQVRTVTASVQTEMTDALAEPRKVLDDAVGELGLPRSIPRVPSVRSAVLSAVTAPVAREADAAARNPRTAGGPLVTPGAASATPAAPPAGGVLGPTAGARLPDDPGLNEMTLTGEQTGTVPSPDQLGTMSLFEHLAELRNRLVVSVVAIVVLSTVSWFFYNDIIGFMRHPYCQYVATHPTKSIGGCNLVTTGPAQGLTTRLKVSGYTGIAVSTPVLFWELWRFITPGLKKNEKRYALPFTGSAVVLFALGVTTAILVFPKVLQFLINVGGTGVVPLFNPSSYFTLYALMCVIFGVVFMYPLVLVALELTGVVPSRTWRRWRRPAIVVIAVVAAVITPSSDPFSFSAMAIPMYIFYELSIVLGRILHK